MRPISTRNGFWRFLLRRVAFGLLTLFFLASLLFVLFHVLPGDPFSMYFDQGFSQQAIDELMHRFGLDKPWWQQYLLYLRNLLRGDFGMSFQYYKPAIQVVGERFWATIALMAASLAIAFGLGVIGGAWMAWRRGTPAEKALGVVALIVRCAPVFWTGMILLSLFSFRLGWLPLGGLRTPGQPITGQWSRFFSLDFLHHLFLPALTAGLFALANPLLVMRSSMLEVVKEDFIRLARAKGLSERAVMLRHAMRNALLPVVTLLAVMAGTAIGGIVLVETVFRWPGMGREIVMAVRARDYPLARTSFFLIGALIVFFNLAADLLYGYLDPRVSRD